MVTTSYEPKSTPSYDLERMRALVQKGKIRFLNPERTLREMEEHHYSHLQVQQCLFSLRPEDFDESVYYEVVDKWNDVYIRKWKNEHTGHIDSLYIKLFLPTSERETVVVSFHPERT